MNWHKFLAALAEGGWSTELHPAGEFGVNCKSTRGDVVIATMWQGLGRKLSHAALNDAPTTVDELAEVLARRATRGTTNRNVRGSSYDRAARRAFLLAKFGDGTTAPCYRCGVDLTDDTITVDRIVPGRDGGRYTRDNIRPACAPCNSETGGMLARREIVTVELPELVGAVSA